MQKNTLKQSKLSGKALAALTLSILLLLSAMFFYLGINGKKMDSEGLRKLLPWLPNWSSNTQWQEAIRPNIDYGVNDVYALNIAPPDEENLKEKVTQTVATLSKRISDMRLNATIVEKDGSYLLVTQKNSLTLTSLEALTSKADFTFADDTGKDFLSGSHITAATVIPFDESGTNWYVSFGFDDEGRQIFAEKTAELVGKTIQLKRDGVLVSQASISEALTQGAASMPGFTQQTAFETAVQMRSGALELEVLAGEKQEGEAVFGKDALIRTIQFLCVFTLAVVIILIVAFRLSGVLASWALLLAIGFNWFLAGLMQLNFELSTLVIVIGSSLLSAFGIVSVLAGLKEQVLKGRSVKNALRDSYKNNGNISSSVHFVIFLLAIMLIIVDNQGLNGHILLFVAGSALISFIAVHVVLRVLVNYSIALFGDKAGLFTNSKEAK